MSHVHTPMENGLFCATCGSALKPEALPDWNPRLLSAREIRERNERTLRRYLELHSLEER